MIFLQTPYGTKSRIVINFVADRDGSLGSHSNQSNQQCGQGHAGIPKMKQTTVAIGRGIIMSLMSMMVICLTQMAKLQALFVLEVHGSTA